MRRYREGKRFIVPAYTRDVLLPPAIAHLLFAINGQFIKILITEGGAFQSEIAETNNMASIFPAINPRFMFISFSFFSACYSILFNGNLHRLQVFFCRTIPI